MLNNIFIFETTGCFIQVYQEKSAVFRENVLRLLYIDLTKHTTYEVKRLRIKWSVKCGLLRVPRTVPVKTVSCSYIAQVRPWTDGQPKPYDGWQRTLWTGSQ